MGVAGYHAAVVATLGAGILAGRSLMVLAALAAVCAISFFAWAYVRRALTGRERLVLLEHVWIAELFSAGTLRLLREPLLPYLDAVSVGLAVFLAWGRTGCLLAGCCHGHPSSVGVRYGQDAARDGFPEHLVGVRLFPVQAIEALGLCGIALLGLWLASGPIEGRALTWFLASYAVMRFGLEGLRADERPHFLGLSQARWMAIVELAAALALGERGATPGSGKIAATILLVSVLVASVWIARNLDPRRRLLGAAHLAELRTLVRASFERARAGGGRPVPEVGRTSRWVSVAVALVDDEGAHVSICLPSEQRDLRLLCDVAAGALPEVDSLTGHTAPATLLHVRAPIVLSEAPPPAAPAVADALYGAVLRRLEREDEVYQGAPLQPVAVPLADDTPPRPTPASQGLTGSAAPSLAGLERRFTDIPTYPPRAPARAEPGRVPGKTTSDRCT
jgi:hypothetical protein